MFVVCLEERAWDSSEHATYCEAMGFQTREMRGMLLEYPLSLIMPVEGRWVEDNGLACGCIGSSVSALTYVSPKTRRMCRMEYP